MSTSIKFRLAAYTDPAGKWNENAPKKGNEDDLFVDANLNNETQGQFVADQIETLSEAGCLMVVADGMGGMNAGEVASAIAIETVKAAFNREQLTEEVLSSPQSRAKYLEKVIIDSDAAIKKRSRNDKDCEGMGSTLILAWLYDNQVTVSWCGDSRAYLYRESDGIKQISKDHSYVQSLVDEGKITIEEAFDHPYGNIVTRSLGDPEKKAEPESITVPVAKGDIILVCSDGLSGVLRDRKSFDREGHILPGFNLEDIIRENRETLKSCREALWNAAESSEWYDNVTAILCEIVEGREVLAPKIEESESDIPTNKSFIHFRVRKKSLKFIAFVIASICLCGLAVFLANRFINPRHHPEFEVFVHKRDSLIRVADSTGIMVLYNQLSTLPDSIDFEAIETIEKDILQRSNIIQRLEELKEKASVLKLEGIVKSICQRIDEICSDYSYNKDITQYETSVSVGEKLILVIDAALDDKAHIFGIKRKRVLSFKEELIQKEEICETDIERWEQLVVSTFEGSNKKIDSQHNNSTELTEVNII